MNWIQNIANTISALWTGNCCQSRIDEAKMVVVEKEPPQTPPPVDNSAKSSENNQSSGSQKVFSPELIMASNKNEPTKWKFFSNPTEMDKLELCKRILKDSFPSDNESNKKKFIKKLEDNLKKKKGVGGKCKLKNGDYLQNINNINYQLNGLQNINDEQLKERIDIILENLNNKEAFEHYMNFYPKTPSSSREGSPEIVFSRESPPGKMTRELYLPARFMTPMGCSRELLVPPTSPCVEIG